MIRKALKNDSGQAAPLVLVCLLGLIAVAGLVIDGGVLFASRRSLQSLADGAARAGAMAVDERVLRESQGGEVRLNPEAARAAVDQYLARSGFTGIVDFQAEPDFVTVKVRRETKPLLLSLVGVGSIATEAEATAYPSAGIEGSGE